MNRSEVKSPNPLKNIVGIHSHPINVWPTGSGFTAAEYRGYKFEMVVIHDGRIFKYSVDDKLFLVTLFYS